MLGRASGLLHHHFPALPACNASTGQAWERFSCITGQEAPWRASFGRQSVFVITTCCTLENTPGTTASSSSLSSSSFSSSFVCGWSWSSFFTFSFFRKQGLLGLYSWCYSCFFKLNWRVHQPAPGYTCSLCWCLWALALKQIQKNANKNNALFPLVTFVLCVLESVLGDEKTLAFLANNSFIVIWLMVSVGSRME